jgi:hypothetical protein
VLPNLASCVNVFALHHVLASLIGKLLDRIQQKNLRGLKTYSECQQVTRKWKVRGSFSSNSTFEIKTVRTQARSETIAEA